MRLCQMLLLATLAHAGVAAHAQQCAGGEVKTREAYQYGRFETRMRSVQGDGVISSFFQYNHDQGCTWPAQNNEIDVEMTGNQLQSVQFTTHYPGPWYLTEIVPVPFNPHADLHDYAFEWEPGVVRWFVDGQLAHTQDAPFVFGLQYPMRIFMNLWATEAVDWAGEWDPSILPASAEYDYVRYYAYTPGTGTTGTGDNYTLQWSDEFDTFDEQRWEKTEFGGFGGNYCDFVSNNVTTQDGKLQLSITAPLAPTASVVAFSVDVSDLALGAGDRIYLNGSFNNWCGTCTPMTDDDGDGVWRRSLNLPAGKHEYLYTLNGWSQIGGAPLGSQCDFSPCDTYGNYGLPVPYGSGPLETPTWCWGSCGDCGVSDSDGDGLRDDVDNCTLASNPAQQDSDGDGIGNACDPDINVLPAGNDCVVNVADLGVLRAAFFSRAGDAHWNPDADLAGANGGPDGVVNAIDLGVMRNLFFGPPGPAAAGCASAVETSDALRAEADRRR